MTMALRMVLPESEHWIEVAERARAFERATGEVAPQDVAASADAPDAERALYGDYRRYSRLAWGALATALWLAACLTSALIPNGFTETLERERGTAWAITATGLLLTIALAAFSVRLLRSLRRAGRALTEALAYWVRLPYRRGERPRADPRSRRARRTHTDPALALRMAGAGISGSLALLGAGLAVFALQRGEAGAALSGALVAAGMLPISVGAFADIRRAAFAVFAPPTSAREMFGVVPADQPFPPAHTGGA